MYQPPQVPEPDWPSIMASVQDGLAFVGRGPDHVRCLNEGFFVATFHSRYPRHSYAVECLVDPQDNVLEMYLRQKRMRFGIERRERDVRDFFGILSEEANNRIPAGSPIKEIWIGCSNDLGYVEMYTKIGELSGLNQEVLFNEIETARMRFDDLLPVIKLAKHRNGGPAAATAHIGLCFDASVEFDPQ